MIISSKRINITPLKAYSINSNQLNWVETYKYLGVIIHKKLSWSNHILQGSSKAMKVLNLLRRTMHGTSNTSKELAYIALVRPHLEYCSPVWNPHQKKYIQDLEKVQKRAARWVGGVRWDSSTKSWTESCNTTCLKLGWLSLVNRRTYLDCYQTFNGLDCINFKDYFKQNKGNLRSNSHNLFIPQSSINAFRYSYFVNATHVWNKLPISVVQSQGPSFKQNLLSHLSLGSLITVLKTFLNYFRLFCSLCVCICYGKHLQIGIPFV